jgi:hypothetical protein
MRWVISQEIWENIAFFGYSNTGIKATWGRGLASSKQHAKSPGKFAQCSLFDPCIQNLGF